MINEDDMIREMIYEIDSKGEDLTPYEIGFIANLIDNMPTYFSENQASIVYRIYDERV